MRIQSAKSLVLSLFGRAMHLPYDLVTQRSSISYGNFRNQLDIGWRKFLKILVTIFGFVIFVALQFLTAKTVIDDKWLYVAMAYFSIVCIIIVVFKPHIAVMTWLVLSPWLALFLHARVGQGALKFNFDNLMLFFLTVTLSIRALKNRQSLKALSLAELLMLCYFLYANVIPLFSNRLTIGAVGSTLSLLQTPFIIYFVTKESFRNPKQIKWAMGVFIVMGLLWALTGWYEHYTGKMWLSSIVGFDIPLQYKDVGTGRARGPADHLYTYGAINILCAFITFHMAGYCQKASTKVLYYIASFIMVIGLLFIYSRTPYLAFGASLFVVMLLTNRDRKRYITASIIIVLAIVIYVPVMINDSSVRNRMENAETYYQRVGMNLTAINIIRHNFLFGVGKVNVQDAINKYVTQMWAGRDTDARGRRVYVAPHNDFLLVFATYGLIGFIFHFGSILCFLGRLIRYRSITPKDSVIGRDFIAIVVAFIVGCFVMMMFGEFQTGTFLYSIIAVILALGVRSAELSSNSQSKLCSQSHLEVSNNTAHPVPSGYRGGN